MASLPSWVEAQAAAAASQQCSASDSSSPPRFEGSEDEGDQSDTMEAGSQVINLEDGQSGTKDQASSSAQQPKQRRSAPLTSMPLLLAAKPQDDILLFESVDPDLDLSGDFGCIGRLHLNKQSKHRDGEECSQEQDVRQSAIMLDLKGRVYDGDILPSNSTLCLVSIDAQKARIDGVFNEFVRLSAPRSSIFDMEAVEQGEFGAHFFDDADGDSNVASADEAQGPLKEKRGGKSPASKPAARAKKAHASGGGVKRKQGAPTAEGRAAKKRKEKVNA